MKFKKDIYKPIACILFLLLFYNIFLYNTSAFDDYSNQFNPKYDIDCFGYEINFAKTDIISYDYNAKYEFQIVDGNVLNSILTTEFGIFEFQNIQIIYEKNYNEESTFEKYQADDYKSGFFSEFLYYGKYFHVILAFSNNGNQYNYEGLIEISNLPFYNTFSRIQYNPEIHQHPFPNFFLLIHSND